jgi:pimeloyl-ACP methyl ester carboxylesterase
MPNLNPLCKFSRGSVILVCAACAFLLNAAASHAQTFNQIQFVIVTGGADLRSDCSATATLKAANGAALQTITLYGGSGSGFANNTTHTVTANLSPALSRSQIASIEITQIEHNGFGETDNNWNVNGVTVSLLNGGSGAQQIVSVSGNPLVRLTGSAPSYTIQVPAGPSNNGPPPGTFGSIQFVIGTGGADLRGDCSATATLESSSGAVLQTITLYNGSGSGFPNNSTNTINATLSTPLKPSDIGKIVITQIEHNNFGETDNNWNINSVTVTLSNPGGGSQQIASASGNPLVRLTGSAPSFTLSVGSAPPPGTFGEIQFVVGTGDADLRSDCDATATLESSSGAVLQTISLYNGSGSGFANNSTNTVTVALNPPLKPSDISKIVITQVEHNGFGETDNNWNVNGITVTLLNPGGGSQEIVSDSGAPMARLTGSAPSFTINVAPPAPAGEFNTVQFTIGTGGADLRSDCVATAALESADGTVLQSFTLYDGTGSGWSNNSTNTVTATLNTPLKPSDVAHVLITQIEHNSGLETDNNWNINNVTVALMNVGSAAQNVLSFSGNPIVRLTGTIPSVLLPPMAAKTGLGMTMPVDPPLEVPNLNLNSNVGDGWLPWGYFVPPAILTDSTSMLSGSCPSSLKACLPAWNGNVNEQDGRLNQFLRINAQSRDAHMMLARAVWLRLNLAPPGNVQGMNCGGTDTACSTALAQLSVTGRQAFNSFVSWNPSFAPDSSGPQVSDLVQLVKTGQAGLPAIGSNITLDQLTQASTAVLTDAYTALWEIRSNQTAWRQFRQNSDWIAVSGEDDTPHRPVNVFTAPYPQFDVAVPVVVGGKAATITARYMIAASSTFMNLVPGQAPTTAPPVPTVAVRTGTAGCATAATVCPARLAIPNDSPTDLLDGQLFNKNVIVYIHGGGSRLEEAVPMANEFVNSFGAWSNDVIVISFDLPLSAYDDPMVTPSDGSERFALDASSSAFENGANGAAPSNFNNFPVLNFSINFINNLIRTLNSQKILNENQVLAVMGGSLGGNTSLLLGMDPLMPPFHLDNPLAFSAPASAPGGAQPTIVSWSPTSMVSYKDEAGTIVGANMCCSLIGGTLTGAGSTWEKETVSTNASNDTRVQYFEHVYFTSTSPGLPPDPEMWYRDDWTDGQGKSATTSLITQSRFDRYEIYSPMTRLWTTSIDTEQAVFSFEDNTDASNNTYKPMYGFIRPRLLLATGACDDYDNGNSMAPFAPPPTISTGSCAGHGLGDTGTNLLAHQDIYGFTHDVANDMRNATGRTLFLNDTGHSIHDERPKFFAQQIQAFLTTADNNIDITLLTGSDDLRWNSEVHAMVGIPTATPAAAGSTVLDFPLNYWFHPWPSTNGSPNNPCGACYKLTAFHLPSASNSNATENNFTIALPSGVSPNTIRSFQLEFIAGTSSAGNTTDAWALAGVAACLPGSNGGFISDGFPPNGTIKDFNPSNDNQPMLWSPPSFQSPATSSLAKNCNPDATNPPPNGDVPSTIWNSGFPATN